MVLIGGDASRVASATHAVRGFAGAIVTVPNLASLEDNLRLRGQEESSIVLYVSPPLVVDRLVEDLNKLRLIRKSGVSAAMFCWPTDNGPAGIAKALGIPTLIFESEDTLQNALQAIRIPRGGLDSEPAGKRAKNELTHRERSVLVALRAGLSIKEIALNLGLSPNTISTYKVRLMQKLHYSSNAELYSSPKE